MDQAIVPELSKVNKSEGCLWEGWKTSGVRAEARSTSVVPDTRRCQAIPSIVVCLNHVGIKISHLLPFSFSEPYDFCIGDLITGTGNNASRTMDCRHQHASTHTTRSPTGP